jgi:hypothetical protein
MKRREFIILLGSAAATWPLAVRAQQQGKVYRVGVLAPIQVAATDERCKILLSVLAARGFVDGQNLAVVQRSADARLERLDGLAAPRDGSGANDPTGTSTGRAERYSQRRFFPTIQLNFGAPRWPLNSIISGARSARCAVAWRSRRRASHGPAVISTSSNLTKCGPNISRSIPGAWCRACA